MTEIGDIAPHSTGGAKIACIGECMIELSAADAMSGLRRLAFGGDTLNTATYLARLGATVDYVTALGDDIYSARMLAGWRGEGIGTGLVRCIAGRLPGLYVIEVDAAGERRFYYWRDRAPAREIFVGAEREELCQALLRFDWLYLTGISLSLYGDEGRACLFDLLRRFRARGGKVAFDDNFRPRGWESLELARATFRRQMSLSDIVLASLDDERALYGVVNFDNAADLIHDAGAPVVLIKDGAGGCVMSTAGQRVHVPAIPVARVVDTTAGGDSFNAGFLSALTAGAALPMAAQLGHACAAVVVGYPGAIVPREDFLMELARYRSALGIG